MRGYVAVCEECDWEYPTLTHDQAEHIGKVHRRRMGHTTAIEEIEEEDEADDDAE
jgi:hypothetical protein